MIWIKIFGLIGVHLYATMSGILEADYWHGKKMDPPWYHQIRVLQKQVGLPMMLYALARAIWLIAHERLDTARFLFFGGLTLICWFFAYRIAFVLYSGQGLPNLLPIWTWDIRIPFRKEPLKIPYPLAGRYKMGLSIYIVALLATILI